MSRIFCSSQTRQHKTAAELFCFPSLQGWGSGAPAPSPSAPGSARLRRRPPQPPPTPARAAAEIPPTRGSFRGRSGDLPVKNREDARGLSARIRGGIQTSHLHYKAGREIGLAGDHQASFCFPALAGNPHKAAQRKDMQLNFSVAIIIHTLDTMKLLNI